MGLLATVGILPPLAIKTPLAQLEGVLARRKVSPSFHPIYYTNEPKWRGGTYLVELDRFGSRRLTRGGAVWFAFFQEKLVRQRSREDEEMWAAKMDRLAAEEEAAEVSYGKEAAGGGREGGMGRDRRRRE